MKRVAVMADGGIYETGNAAEVTGYGYVCVWPW